MPCLLLLKCAIDDFLFLPLLCWLLVNAASPKIATKMGRREGRHAGKACQEGKR